MLSTQQLLPKMCTPGAELCWVALTPKAILSTQCTAASGSPHCLFQLLLRELCVPIAWTRAAGLASESIPLVNRTTERKTFTNTARKYIASKLREKKKEGRKEGWKAGGRERGKEERKEGGGKGRRKGKREGRREQKKGGMMKGGKKEKKKKKKEEEEGKSPYLLFAEKLHYPQFTATWEEMLFLQRRFSFNSCSLKAKCRGRDGAERCRAGGTGQGEPLRSGARCGCGAAVGAARGRGSGHFAAKFDPAETLRLLRVSPSSPRAPRS